MRTGLNAGGLRMLCGNEVIKRVRSVRDANADVVDGSSSLTQWFASFSRQPCLVESAVDRVCRVRSAVQELRKLGWRTV